MQLRGQEQDHEPDHDGPVVLKIGTKPSAPSSPRKRRPSVSGGEAVKNSLLSCCFSPSASSTRTWSGALANANITAGGAAGTSRINAGSSAERYSKRCTVAVVEEELPMPRSTISLQRMTHRAGRRGSVPASTPSPLAKRPARNASCTNLIRRTSGHYDAPVGIENTAASSATAGRYEQFRCRPEDRLRIKIFEVEETDDEARAGSSSSTGSKTSKNSLFSCSFSPSSRARRGALAKASRSRTAGAAGTTSKNAGSSGAGWYLERCAVAVVADELPPEPVTHTISLRKMPNQTGCGGVFPAPASVPNPPLGEKTREQLRFLHELDPQQHQKPILRVEDSAASKRTCCLRPVVLATTTSFASWSLVRLPRPAPGNGGLLCG
ncbi:unnamed protein product [Amoebophrya sp. A120]|nr:unnamed protein product [Amoebophrya sp. A120]|eukprot:GSA120T00011147001.1